LSDTRDIISEFFRDYPQYKKDAVSIDRQGNIRTKGGKILASFNGDTWVIKSVGGRPTQDRLKHDIRVRVTDHQYKKLNDYADCNGLNRAQAVRKLIDNLE